MTRRVHLAATLLLKAPLTDSREAATNLTGEDRKQAARWKDTSHLATDPAGPQVEQLHTAGDAEHTHSPVRQAANSPEWSLWTHSVFASSLSCTLTSAGRFCALKCSSE